MTPVVYFAVYEAFGGYSMVRKQLMSTVAVAAMLVAIAPLTASAEPAQVAVSRASAPVAHDDDGGGLKDVDNRLGSTAYRPSAAQKQALKRLGDDVVAGWSKTGSVHSLMAARGALTKAGSGSADAIARGFIRDQRALFGLTPAEVKDLRLTMNDHDESGATFLRYQQSAEGRDVFGGNVLVTVDAKKRVLFAGGNLVPDASSAPAATLSAEDAVVVANDDLSPQENAKPGKRLATKNGKARFANTMALDDYRGAAPVEAILVNVATADGVRAAWQITADVASNALYTELVDARSGAVLYRKNQVENDNDHGTVFTGDDPDAGGRSQQSFAGWVDAGGQTTAGNNTNTYQDAEGDDAADGDGSDQPQNADRHFDYAWTDTWGNGTGAEADLPLTGADRDAVVTQLFYYTNWFHDYAYGLGFTETARNFQNDNFGNGGSDGDAVEAESDANFTGTQCLDNNNNAIKCLNNANFTTNGSDGNVPRMQMYVGSVGSRFTQRANNRDTVIHEYTHGISGRIISDTNLAGGLQSGALGEGWSDALATSINNDPVYGEYNNGDTVNGIRGTAYDANARDYGDLCTIATDNMGNPICQVHNDGTIWATMMWEVRESLQAKYGDATGKDEHERLLILGMKATPDTPSFADARNGYLAADYLRNPTGTFLIGENYCRLWKVFADNELGTGSNDADDDSTPTVNTDTPDACDPTASIAAVPDTAEGSVITFDASASTVGGDPGDTLSYAWDLDGDGQYDDSTKAAPKRAYGDNGSRTVGLQLTNSAGYTDTASVSFTVTNVAPSVSIDLSDLAGMEEGDTREVAATFTDPGWLDTYSGNVDLGTADRPDVSPSVVVDTHGGQGTADDGGATPDIGSATADVTYGDNGTYTVTVDITDDDAGTGSSAADATVANVNPTSVIDEGGHQVYDGVSAFILKAGESLDVPASSTDPGSDDLTFRWDWDGPLLNGETPDEQTSLVNPPNADPALSPTVQPRDVSLQATHAFAKACLYEIETRVTDDDGGFTNDNTVALITGNATVSKGHGWWLNEYRPKGNAFTPETLQCYLDIVGYLSMVFDEKTDASTREAAAKVLNAPAKAPEAVIFDQHALGAWLNFANGSIRLDSPVDTNNNGINDSTFGEVMFTAESVRINPASTSAQIKEQKNIVERIALQSGP